MYLTAILAIGYQRYIAFIFVVCKIVIITVLIWALQNTPSTFIYEIHNYLKSTHTSISKHTCFSLMLSAWLCMLTIMLLLLLRPPPPCTGPPVLIRLNKVVLDPSYIHVNILIIWEVSIVSYIYESAQCYNWYLLKSWKCFFSISDT